MIFHHPDFLVPPQALGALRAVRDVRVRSAGPANTPPSSQQTATVMEIAELNFKKQAKIM